MPPKHLGQDAFDTATYGDATSRFTAVRARLPEEAVSGLANEAIGRLSRHGAGARVARSRVEALARALIDPDRDLCWRMILELEAKGEPIESLYLDHLGAAARRLGELWTSDEVSFAEVSVGTARIYGLLRALNVPSRNDWADGRPAALFCSSPGEEHTLGIRMAADLFRRRGWQIDLLLGLDHEGLLDRFDASPHRLVGVSAARVDDLAALAKLLVALRSHRPGVRVLVSGNLVADLPDAVAELSPDAMAPDFEGAFAAMTALWGGPAGDRA